MAIIDSGAPGALDAGFDDIDYDISLKENVQYDVDGSGAIVKTADTVTYSGEPHGHEMAQVVGSITNGIAPDANIIHGNISDSIGSTNRVSLWKGIEWAANNNADVVNASFDFNGLSYVYDAGPNPGGYTAGEIEIESIAQLVMSKDMAIVHAAGNGFGFTASDGVYDISGSASAVKTALKSQLLIVGAMNETMDAVADYSNVAGSDVDTQDRFVMAPAASQTAGGTIYGTSPAAANVSGAIALMKSRWMNLGGRELTQIILDTADSTFSAYSAEIYGQGITDLNKAYAPIGSATFKYADGNAPIQAASFTLPAGFNDVSFQTAFVDSYERDYETSFTMTANKPTSKFTQQVLLAQTTPQKRVVALN
nr:S8 family serine peptidase [Spirochaetales bacterium]